MLEQEIRRILGKDLSVGTEAFRDSLLKRCLSVLDSGSEDGIELDDDQIELLAAAGSLEVLFSPEDMGGAFL